MIEKRSTVGKLAYVVAGLIIVVAFFYSSFSIFLVFFLIVVLTAIFKATTKKNFLKLQAVLPTSNIRSLAMGMVEIKGKTRCQQLIQSKIGDTNCIAYHYTVHRETKDSEGKTRYTLIEEEQNVMPFSVEDDTGIVGINIEGLDFVWLPESGSYRSGSLHYKQTVLMPDDEVLLIGKATSTAGKVSIEKDDINNVFNITLASSVDKWNTYKPLLNSLYVFGVLCCVLAIFVAKIDVSIVDGIAIYNFNHFFR